MIEKNTIRECLAHTILLSKLTDVNIFLLRNSRIINFEAVAADLITDKCWVYHYYLPSAFYKKNFILLGYKNDIERLNIIDVLDPETIYTDIDEILEVFANYLSTTCIHISLHSLHWRDPEYVSTLLDVLCYGMLCWLPAHWGSPNPNVSLIPVNIYEKYFIFLNEKKLLNNQHSVLFFYKYGGKV